uniref:CAP-Gly domain-containing protein n=1 Tax=Plectus sambesii TaxID=2011161 RepID=A0A914URF1_9BILA
MRMTDLLQALLRLTFLRDLYFAFARGWSLRLYIACYNAAVKSANAVNGTDRKRQPSGTPGSAMPSASSTSTVGLRPSKPTGEPKASTSNGTTSNGATAALPVPSSHAIRSRPTPNGKPAAPASNTSVELKRLHEEVNMGQKRLAYAVKGFDALAVVAEHSRRKMTALNTQRIDTERRLRQNIDDLAGKIETLTSERTQLCELHTRSLESLHNKHADELTPFPFPSSYSTELLPNAAKGDRPHMSPYLLARLVQRRRSIATSDKRGLETEPVVLLEPFSNAASLMVVYTPAGTVIATRASAYDIWLATVDPKRTTFARSPAVIDCNRL